MLNIYLNFARIYFRNFLAAAKNAKLKINKIVRFRCQAGRTSVCFSLYFCLRRLSIYYHQECIKKKKSEGDYNVKRLTRRLTRIKSVDARNIIRNVLAFAEAVTLFPILIFALFPFFRFRNILFEFPFF